jgi:hypothetical protein
MPKTLVVGKFIMFFAINLTCGDFKSRSFQIACYIGECIIYVSVWLDFDHRIKMDDWM